MIKKLIILTSILIVTLATGYFVNKNRLDNITSILKTTNSAIKPIIVPKEHAKVADKITSEPIPLSYKIENVPFITQAPLVNWDELHDEACEEASLIIAKYYLDNTNLTPQVAEEEIQNMVVWEERSWGGHFDLTAQQTVDLAKEYYGMKNLTVKNINSNEDIKKEISQNHLVIVPAAGRLLGNPNFRNPGPIYHMLVVTGYNEEQIITNDPGTRNGENYTYSNGVFLNAIHDWTGNPNNIETGAKVMIVVNQKP